MLKKYIYKLLRHRHFWRDATFDELSEIYISMMFRSLALSLIGIFIPVFLIKTGYDLGDVAIFFICLFATRTVLDVIAGYVVARFGPKHTMAGSYILQIAAASLFLTLPAQHWPLFSLAFLWGAAISLFTIAFHVDFSKVKHNDHGGKELGYVTIIERVGGTIGPLVGGILATIFAPQYIFLIAIVLFFTGLVPLFKTIEPVKTHQKLDFMGLQFEGIKKDLISHSAFIVETNLCAAIWPIFLTMFVFVDDTYAKIGILSSIGFMASVFTAYSVGKIVDGKKGGELLRFAAIGNALLYVLRPFANSIPFVLGINVANEIFTVGYRLPFMKGMYDAADHLPGLRIVYFVTMLASSSFVKLLIWIQLYLLTWLFAPKIVLIVGFAVSATASLLILTQRFPALAYNKVRHE